MTDDPVTPQVILTHMYAMEGRLRGEMKSMEKRIKSELRKDIYASAQRIIHQIDAIDKRLDDVEIEIPKIKKFVGMPQ